MKPRIVVSRTKDDDGTDGVLLVIEEGVIHFRLVLARDDARQVGAALTHASGPRIEVARMEAP